MNKLFRSFIYVSVLVLASCVDNKDGFLYQNGASVRVTANAANFEGEAGESDATRTVLTPADEGTSFKWKVGDVAAVYSEEKGMTNFFIDDESISEDGSTAEFYGSGFTLTPNSTYYAFYPYSSDAQSLDKQKIPVSYDGQNIKSNGDNSGLGDFDYMFARGVTDENGLVSLNFKHLGCVVRFLITVPQTAYYTSLKLERSDGSPFSSSGYVNIAADIPAIELNKDSGKELVVSLNSANGGISVESGKMLQVSVMLMPQNMSGQNIRVTLVDNNGNEQTATVAGRNMRAGYTYTYHVGSGSSQFTAVGSGLPNDDFNPTVLSIYSHDSKQGYEGMIMDGNILYSSGMFGLRAIDYSNPQAPYLYNSIPLEELTDANTMRPRSIALKDNYLYIPIRQNSSCSTEKYSPERKFTFEGFLGSYNFDSNSLSDNTIANSFFQSLSLSSINMNQKMATMYLYKAHYQSGYYLNTIRFIGEDGKTVALLRETFPTKEEALAVLKNEYSLAAGDYCKVDWSQIPEGGKVLKNVTFYKPGEFDTFMTTGAITAASASEPCPSRGENSICFEADNSTGTKGFVLFSNITDHNSGYLTFWCKIGNGNTSDIEIPVMAKNGSPVLSMVCSSTNSSSYTVGIRSENKSSMSSTSLEKDCWYQFKIKLTSTTSTLFWRTKEGGTWADATTISQSQNYNQLCVGMNTSGAGSRMWIDNLYWHPTEIDKVSDVNGCLAIVDKNTLETTRGYHLDVKAIDVKVHENRLVMTCFYGFNVYDITDPSNPLLTYSYRTNNFKEFQNCCIYENNGKVYVIICNYSQGYMIADITDVNKVNIVYVNDYKNMMWNGENLYNKIYSFDVVVDYPYAYFTSSTMSAYRNTDDDRRGVMTVNLTNITSPTSSFSFVPQDKITTATNGDPQPTHIAKIGNRLLVNNGEKGLLIFNTSGGEAIYESALSLPEQSFANQIFVSDQGRVFVNDGASGGTNYPGRNIYLIGGF